MSVGCGWLAMHHARGSAPERNSDTICNYFAWHTSPYVTKLFIIVKIAHFITQPTFTCIWIPAVIFAAFQSFLIVCFVHFVASMSEKRRKKTNYTELLLAQCLQTSVLLPMNKRCFDGGCAGAMCAIVPSTNAWSACYSQRVCCNRKCNLEISTACKESSIVGTRLFTGALPKQTCVVSSGSRSKGRAGIDGHWWMEFRVRVKER